MYTQLFTEAKTDADKQLLNNLEAQHIYADDRGKLKALAMAKVLLLRRGDLKSKYFEQF